MPDVSFVIRYLILVLTMLYLNQCSFAWRMSYRHELLCRCPPGAGRRGSQRASLSRFASSFADAEKSKTKATTTTPYTISCPPTPLHTLEKVVTKHALQLDRYLRAKPIAPHTQAAFDELLSQLLPSPSSSSPLSIILDSGCGTGRSTFHLGRLFPGKIVVGVDKSLARLTRNLHYHTNLHQQLHHQPNMHHSNATSFLLQHDNVFLVRAELVDFWRCLRKATQEQLLTIDDHYLLYPNPYPKPARLSYRWYGHASFPLLLDVSPRLVVRSNWEQYLIELARVVQVVDQQQRTMTTMADNSKPKKPVTVSTILGPTLLPSSSSSSSNHDLALAAWTNFEAKYHQAGEPTYELVVIRNSLDL